MGFVLHSFEIHRFDRLDFRDIGVLIDSIGSVASRLNLSIGNYGSFELGNGGEARDFQIFVTV